MACSTTTAPPEARIPQDLHARLRRAAELEGRSITDFVIHAIQQATQASLERTTILKLSIANQETFAQILLDPPPVAPALTKAFERHQELFGEKPSKGIDIDRA